jgi:trk system potassium uptake protein TrkH
MSALTTTGFMVEGMGDWPDSMKMLLLLLMLLGGSSLSLSSGFKVHRFFLLIKGFLAEVKRSSHPSAVFSLKRGEGIYSEKALESANMSFFYLFGLLVVSMGILLLFHGNIFETLSLSVTSISNSGIAFGTFSTVEGISSLNWFEKMVLFVIMFLGRFEVLLPLYVLSLRGRRFTG